MKDPQGWISPPPAQRFDGDDNWTPLPFISGRVPHPIIARSRLEFPHINSSIFNPECIYTWKNNPKEKKNTHTHTFWNKIKSQFDSKRGKLIGAETNPNYFCNDLRKDLGNYRQEIHEIKWIWRKKPYRILTCSSPSANEKRRTFRVLGRITGVKLGSGKTKTRTRMAKPNEKVRFGVWLIGFGLVSCWYWIV